MNTIKCRKCGAQHSLKYQLQVNDSLHLIYQCEGATIYAPFVPNLDIPIEESKKRLRSKMGPIQQFLSNNAVN